MQSSYLFLYHLILIFSLLIPLRYATPITKPPENLVKRTCQKCAEMSSYHISNDFCYSSLDKIPTSHVTDLSGLGVVAMEIALQDATTTVSYISNMLDERKDSSCNICLESCLELYLGMSAILEDCIGQLLAMQYDHVQLWVSTIMQAPGICEAGFTDKGKKSPMTKENYSVSQLCSIVLCIIDMINPDLKSQSSILRLS